MYTALVLALTLGVAVADVGLGYKYKVPATPFGSLSSPANTYNKAYSVTSNPTVSFGTGSSLTTGTVGNRIIPIIGQSSTVSSGPLGQGSILPSTTFSQSSEEVTTSFGQSSSVSSGLGQGPVVSAPLSGQASIGNTGYNTFGSSGLASKFGVGSGTGYKVIKPLPLNTKYVTGSTGSSSNYNTFGTTGGVGSGVSGSGSNTNYNTLGSTGTNNYYVQQPTNLGTNTNYNTGSSYVPNQQATYPGQGLTFGQNQGTYQTTVDTTGLDNIGIYYQQASAANQFISTNQYQNTGAPNYQNYYNQVKPQPTQVFKHYYVHAAPEDLEPLKPRPQIVLPPPQKHYKIIFIKTPAPPPSVPQVIPVPQQNEEKTIVYVLVKKPNEVNNIVLPKFEQKAPTKPDVFFIKYNDKQDSQSLIDNIVSDYNKGKVSTSYVPSSAGSGGKTGSSFTSSSANSAFNQNTGSTIPFESVFGKNPNVGNSFGTSIGGISSTTASSVPFGYSSTSHSKLIDDRFGSISDGSVSSVSSFSTTGNSNALPSSSLSSSNSYTVGNTLNINPSVSYETVSELGSKPSIQKSSGPSVSYSTGSSSLYGPNTGILVTKPSSASVSSTNTFSSGSGLSLASVSPSSVIGSNSFILDTDGKPSKTGTSSSLSSFEDSTGSFDSPTVSSTVGSTPNTLSSLNNFGSDSSSISSISESGYTEASTSSNSNKIASGSVYVSKPISSSNPSSLVSGNTLSSRFVGSDSSLTSFSSYKPPTIPPTTPPTSGSILNNKASSLRSPALSISSGIGSSGSSASYNSDLNSYRFGTALGSSKSDAGLDSESTFKSTFVSTSQGVPHETYGPPKFKVL